MNFFPEKENTVLLKSCDSVTITKLSKYEFTVKPCCKAKKITLYAIDSLNNDTLQKIEYKLRNIPNPEIYVGNVNDSSTIRLLPNCLISCHANEYVPYKCPYRISSAEIVALDRTFKITGDRIPKEIVDELNLLRNLYGTPNLSIQISAIVACSSCIARKMTITLILI